MAREHRVGDLLLMSGEHDCENEGCKNKTNAGIWVGDRWRMTCEDHQAEVQNELRKKGLRGR